VSSIIAEVEMQGEPEFGFRNDALGVNAMRPIEGGRVGVVVRDEHADREGDLTLEDLRKAIVAVWGSDFGLASADMISRFTDATRQAANYRAGRVLLAGDAAHIHSPAGGQGLNLGVQDAANLGWKLARVVTGVARADLLDTYHAERHPAAARVLKYTMALTALQRGDDRTSALIEMVGDVLDVVAARDRLAGLVSGLDIHYDLGGDHPLVGRRMPDLDLATASGPMRVYTLLHSARPVLINLGEPESLDPGDWTEQLELIDATYEGAWELPVLGEVPAPAAVLIRPDGYVAWVGDRAQVGLEAALAAWLGAPATP
jgi:3-(3-hydroxy-phenyl)propionate hydroxylase